MKIVLCSINSKFIHSSLGVWYLYSAYKQTQTHHTVTVYETTINNQIEDIVADLTREKGEVIGFSCYIWNIEYVKKIAMTLKQINPKLIIFLGGPQASFDACDLLKNEWVDLIIKGEGEQPFVQLLKSDFHTSSQIVEQDYNCKTYYNPYTPEYFAALGGRICYLETSRGCPFSCAFCLSGASENVRFFDMDISKQNIIALANSGTQTVKFVDRTFNCNVERTLEIFIFITEQREKGEIPRGIVFHFEIEADLLTKEILDYLATVPKGLFQFEAGLQSFNVKTLQAVNRRSDINRLVGNLKAIVEMGNIHLHIDLIAGLPYEDYDSFTKGFDLAYKIRANVIQLGFLKLLKGSTLERENALYNYKYLQYPPYQVLSNDSISYEDLLKLKTAEDVVERLLNSGRFAKTIEFLLEKTALAPYQLFFEFGEYVQRIGLHSPSLDTYTTALFEYFKGREGIEERALRDVIAYDRITTDRGGKLFACLHINDERLKHISIAFKNVELGIFQNQQEKARQSKLGFCIIYSQGTEKVLVADYTDYDSVKGIYASKMIELSEILAE
ncbi:MAG: DUF4080 domain-containing protein [Oscillospiraceae bacterium]